MEKEVKENVRPKLEMKDWSHNTYTWDVYTQRLYSWIVASFSARIFEEGCEEV